LCSFFFQHGVADLDAAAKTILRDWAFNEFPYYTMPPKAQNEDEMTVDEDEEVLQFQRTRKEMRSKGKGLIKFDLSSVDEREVSSSSCVSYFSL
jgi:nuclear GTP-binding protein